MMMKMWWAVAAAVCAAGTAAGATRWLEEKDGAIWLGTDCAARDYAFTARADNAKMDVDVEVKDGRLHHFRVRQDKLKWERRTFVFKADVVKDIPWAKGAWPDPSVGANTTNGLTYVRTDLGQLQCVLSHRIDADIDFEVNVDGRAVAVHDASASSARGWYNFATFDADKPVTVEVRCKSRDLRAADILPLRKGWKKRVIDDRTIAFEATPPFQLAVEPSGRDAPLFIFGNTPERDAPKAGDPDVIWFGPGVHEAGVVRPKSNQTVYLADGAVVRGRIAVENATNVTIRGRGIVCENHLTRFSAPGPLTLRNCRDVRVEGITLRGSVNWTFVMSDSADIDVRNIKICGARMINDDGIDICNTSRVSVRDSFIYTIDDCFAPKGMNGRTKLPVDNLRAENCVLWTETANIIRVGFECDTTSFSDYVFRDLYVLHMDEGSGKKPIGAMWADAFVSLESANGARMHNHLYENIHIDDPRTNVYVAAVMAGTFRPKKDAGAGTIKNIRLRNITAPRAPTGPFGRYSAVVTKPDGRIDDVALENAPPPAEVRVDPATRNVSFPGK